VVSARSGAERYWQRPRGGQALLVGDLVGDISVTLYRQSGDMIWHGTLAR
jgi:hypothetical protein